MADNHVLNWGLSVLIDLQTAETVTFTRENENRGDVDLALTVPRYIWEGTLDRARILVLDVQPFDREERDDDERTPTEVGILQRLDRIERELARMRREAYAATLRLPE